MSHVTRMIRLVRHWHARAGVLAALFFLILALTGLALNHTDRLDLDGIQVRASWLMRWYGLHTETPQQGYLLGGGYFVGNSQAWVMDGRLLAHDTDAVVGVAEVGGLRYVVTSSSIHIYQPGGSLVEKLGGSALPVSRILRVGVDGELLVIESDQAMFATADGLDWRPHASGQVAWSGPVELPSQVRGEIHDSFAPGLPLERILLDLHSGRIFGKWGPLAMDLAALVLIVLSISGLWIYFRTVRRKH